MFLLWMPLLTVASALTVICDHWLMPRLMTRSVAASALTVICDHCSAAEHIQRGEAELMLAGGAEAAIIPSGMGGFIACKALSRRNEDPTKASRPWDKNRDGFVMGEGAGESPKDFPKCDLHSRFDHCTKNDTEMVLVLCV